MGHRFVRSRSFFLAGAMVVLVAMVMLSTQIGARQIGPDGDTSLRAMAGAATSQEAVAQQQEPAADENDDAGVATDPSATRGADDRSRESDDVADPVPDGSAADAKDRIQESDDVANPVADEFAADSASGPREVLEGFLATTDEILRSEDPDLTPLESLATGWAIEAVQATLIEYQAEGYRQRGGVSVKDVETVGGSAADGQVTLEACVDSSAVKLVRTTGEQIDTAASSEGGTLHHYEVVREGNSWVVTSHSYPDEPRC